MDKASYSKEQQANYASFIRNNLVPFLGPAPKAHSLPHFDSFCNDDFSPVKLSWNFPAVRTCAWQVATACWAAPSSMSSSLAGLMLKSSACWSADLTLPLSMTDSRRLSVSTWVARSRKVLPVHCHQASITPHSSHTDSNALRQSDVSASFHGDIPEEKG